MKERVFRFRAQEKRIAASRAGFKVVDLGCGRGDNLRRLLAYGGKPVGVEPDLARARQAGQIAPTVVGVGERPPLAGGHFDMVYVSHALHHTSDVPRVLAESMRLLAPGGLLFVIETIDDSPLMRLLRSIQPSWEGDPVLSRFRYGDLVEEFEQAGFEILAGEKFNWMYFAWELFPMIFRPFEFLTPLFIGVETLFHRLLGRRWGGHCFLVARKPGPPVFGYEGTEAGTQSGRAE